MNTTLFLDTYHSTDFEHVNRLNDECDHEKTFTYKIKPSILQKNVTKIKDCPVSEQIFLIKTNFNVNYCMFQYHQAVNFVLKIDHTFYCKLVKDNQTAVGKVVVLNIINLILNHV